MTSVMTMVIKNRTVPRDTLRVRIYEAAIAEFRARGFDATTVEAIAARAHVAKGTLFNFYRSKLDVLMEYYREIDARLAPLRRSLEPADPVASLTAYARAVERELRREGSLARDLLDKLSAVPQMRELDSASGKEDAQDFAAMLARCRTAGTLCREIAPEMAATLVMDMWAGAVRDWTAQDCAPGLADLYAQRLRHLFAGIGGRRR